DAPSFGGHQRQRAENSGGDPRVGRAAVDEELDRQPMLGSRRRGEYRFSEERSHQPHPLLAQRTAPRWAGARVSILGQATRSPGYTGVPVPITPTGGSE